MINFWAFSIVTATDFLSCKMSTNSFAKLRKSSQAHFYLHAANFVSRIQTLHCLPWIPILVSFKHCPCLYYSWHTHSSFYYVPVLVHFIQDTHIRFVGTISWAFFQMPWNIPQNFRFFILQTLIIIIIVVVVVIVKINILIIVSFSDEICWFLLSKWLQIYFA